MSYRTLARLVLIAMLVAVLAPLGAVARQDATPAAEPATGGWTNFKGDAGRTGVADAGPTGQPVELWRIQARASCNPPPAIVAGVVYAPCDDGNLYALDAATGTERWRFAGTGLDEVTVVGTLVYVNDAGVLRALDAATGQERWQAAVPGGTSAVVEDGLLVVGTGDGFLLALDAATGAERWRFQVTTQGAAHNPALGGGIAYAGGDAADFFAVDAASGTLLWRGDTGDDQTGTAVVADEIAYIGGSAESGEGHLYAFDAQTGALLWRRDEAIATPAVLDGVGYAGSVAGIVYAFDTATGAERWRVQLGEVVRPVAVAPGVVYAPSDVDQVVYALDAATGTQLWKFAVRGGIDGSLAMTGGVVYVTTGAGNIYAIGGTDQGAVPVASPVPATPSAAAAATGPAQFLWQTDGGPTAFVGAVDAAIGPDGNVWVLVGGPNHFEIFAPDGTYLETWGGFGSGPGQFSFDHPESVVGHLVFDAQGNLYVGDGLNDRIQKFDRNRTFVTAWGSHGTGDGQFLHIAGLAIGVDGQVVVCDRDRADCQVFDPDGTFRFAFGGAGSGPAPLDTPAYMTSDAAGNVYVADSGAKRVVKFAPDGTLLAAWGSAGNGPGQFNQPSDVAVDAAGNVYVADAGNGRIAVLDAEGRYLAEWDGSTTPAGRYAYVLGVAVDGEGNLYAVDIALGLVQKFRLLPPLAPAASAG